VVLTEDDFPIPQSNYLHASYDQLRESVYSALALQTRLKPYLDAIQITLNANGEVAFDFTRDGYGVEQQTRQRAGERRAGFDRHS
jgi:hypothetical protein